MRTHTLQCAALFSLLFAPVVSHAAPSRLDLSGWNRVPSLKCDCGPGPCVRWDLSGSQVRGRARVKEAGIPEGVRALELGQTFRPPAPELIGRRRTLQLPSGRFIGFDAGEWGGSLWWIPAEGAIHVQGSFQEGIRQ
jgi:hypothetical protein